MNQRKQVGIIAAAGTMLQMGFGVSDMVRLMAMQAREDEANRTQLEREERARLAENRRLALQVPPEVQARINRKEAKRAAKKAAKKQR